MMTSLLHLKTENSTGPIRPSQRQNISQNAFHRGQYANFSTAANGSSGFVLQIQEGAGLGYVAETRTAYVL